MRGLPELAWGFYGHRLNLYRNVRPHEGFQILSRWTESKSHGLFIFTSNVDGHFQKAGVSESRIVEGHGSIHFLQCLEGCSRDIWPVDGLELIVDDETCNLLSPLPRCPHCGRIARPNILMFNDYGWIEDRSERQLARLNEWVGSASKLAIVELGAGKAIPTVRRFGERFGRRVVRINPQEFAIASHLGIGISGGALEVLSAIDAALTR